MAVDSVYSIRLRYEDYFKCCDGDDTMISGVISDLCDLSSLFTLDLMGLTGSGGGSLLAMTASMVRASIKSLTSKP